MKFVLDASVALKWVLAERDAEAATRLRDDFRRGVHELIAPEVLPIEVAHALARAERRGIILPGEGATKLADILDNLPDLFPYLPLLPDAFSFASQARIGVYDCLYVALAEREDCSLVTADDRLARALPGRPIVTLASLP